MAFFQNPGKLWIVRTEGGGRSHLSESAKGGKGPRFSTLCGRSIRRDTKYAEAKSLTDVTCKQCKKAQRIFDLGLHGERFWQDSVPNPGF
jgi:hypothetical protein